MPRRPTTGARGGGMTPLVASTPEGSQPQGGERVLEQEHIVVGVVIGMMRPFQCLSEALISRWDRDEARALAPLRFCRVNQLSRVAFTVNSRR